MAVTTVVLRLRAIPGQGQRADSGCRVSETEANKQVGTSRRQRASVGGSLLATGWVAKMGREGSALAWWCNTRGGSKHKGKEGGVGWWESDKECSRAAAACQPRGSGRRRATLVRGGGADGRHKGSQSHSVRVAAATRTRRASPRAACLAHGAAAALTAAAAVAALQTLQGGLLARRAVGGASLARPAKLIIPGGREGRTGGGECMRRKGEEQTVLHAAAAAVPTRARSSMRALQHAPQARKVLATPEALTPPAPRALRAAAAPPRPRRHHAP